MSKIVVAANAMIENKDKISEVVPGWNDSEVFFMFNKKYKWSVFRRTDGHFSLIYYPGRQSLDELASWEDHDWAEFSQLVTYTSKDIGTRESVETFQELYNLVNSLKYGMENVLDDIIDSLEF